MADGLRVTALLIASLAGLLAKLSIAVRLDGPKVRLGRRSAACHYVAGVYIDQGNDQETVITQRECTLRLSAPLSTMTGTISGTSLSLSSSEFAGGVMVGKVDPAGGAISISDGLIILKKKCGYLAGKYTDNTTEARSFDCAQEGCQLSITGPFQKERAGTSSGSIGSAGIITMRDGSTATIDQYGGIIFPFGLYLGHCDRIAGNYYVDMVLTTVTQRTCHVKITTGASLSARGTSWTASLVEDLVKFDGGVHTGSIKSNGDIVCTNGLHLQKEMKIEEVSEVKARGDPHLTNTKGQKFDIMKSGTYTMIQAPRGAKPSESLLTIEARTKDYGALACHSIYIDEVRLLGKWAQEKSCRQEGNAGCPGVITIHAKDKRKPAHARQFIKLHNVQIKLVRALTDSGIHYLNLVVHNLSNLEVPIGGVLGEDSHDAVAAGNSTCGKNLMLAAGPKAPMHPKGSLLAAFL